MRGKKDRLTTIPPFALSLSKGAGLKAWFDRLTTNGRKGRLTWCDKFTTHGKKDKLTTIPPFALSLSWFDKLTTNGKNDKLTMHGKKDGLTWFARLTMLGLMEKHYVPPFALSLSSFDRLTMHGNKDKLTTTFPFALSLSKGAGLKAWFDKLTWFDRLTMLGGIVKFHVFPFAPKGSGSKA